MFINLGLDTVITADEIIGIFDLEGTTVSKRTRDYLSAATKGGRVVTIGYDMPKSFVVCNDKKGAETVYVSPLAASTLNKRIN